MNLDEIEKKAERKLGHNTNSEAEMLTKAESIDDFDDINDALEEKIDSIPTVFFWVLAFIIVMFIKSGEIKDMIGLSKEEITITE